MYYWKQKRAIGKQLKIKMQTLWKAININKEKNDLKINTFGTPALTLFNFDNGHLRSNV